MTAQTSFVRHMGAKTCGVHMTHVAVTSQHGMGRRQRAFCVDILVAGSARKQNPSDRNDREAQAKPQTPFAKSITAREILKVNALGQGFRGAYAGHTSESQSHDCVDCTQDKQSVRGRNMQEEPAMKEFVKTALALQLSLFFDDVFQVIELRPQARGDKNS